MYVFKVIYIGIIISRTLRVSSPYAQSALFVHLLLKWESGTFHSGSVNISKFIYSNFKYYLTVMCKVKIKLIIFDFFDKFELILHMYFHHSKKKHNVCV